VPTGVLFGQIIVVFGVALGGVWTATQWTAAALGYQSRHGAPWLNLSGVPVYEPWKLFEWWYFFDAYAPGVFLRGGAIAASSGLLATGAAISTAVWRARSTRRVTTYGSARWAEHEEIEKAGLTKPEGVFLGSTYQRSLQLASGRFALLDDGKSFSRIPWRPVLEKRLGQQVAAIVRGTSVN